MSVSTLVLTADEQIAAEVVPTVRANSTLVVEGKDAEDLWPLLRSRAFDAVVVDRRLLAPSAPAAVAQLRALPEAPGVLVLIGREDPVARAELLAAGATAVLSRTTPPAELAAALVAVTKRAAERIRTRALQAQSEDKTTLGDLRSKSPRMLEFLQLLRRVATADTSLLVQGETGSGKEYLAKAIHRSSSRRGGPFVPIHCASFSEALLESELFGHVEGAFTGASRGRRGFFELADGGTVFLDEIGELSSTIQVKLLRVLQERIVFPVGSEESRTVDVRIMAATNRDLSSEMASGRFRPDLFYRLSVVSLRVPALRERAEDIPALAARQLESIAANLGRIVKGLSAAALDVLVSHSWPGNIRELTNALERALLLGTGPWITPDDLSFLTPATAAGYAGTPRADAPFVQARDRHMADFESRYLRDLLTRTGGRVGAAARLADLNERTLYEKMRRHGIRKEAFRQRP